MIDDVLFDYSCTLLIVDVFVTIFGFRVVLLDLITLFCVTLLVWFIVNCLSVFDCAACFGGTLFKWMVVLGRCCLTT